MKKKPIRQRTIPHTPTASMVPHSWGLSNWPPNVYPNDRRKALYLVRIYRRELLEAQALVRVGRELVLIGEPYARWLKRRIVYVPGYQVAANHKPLPMRD